MVQGKLRELVIIGSASGATCLDSSNKLTYLLLPEQTGEFHTLNWQSVYIPSFSWNFVATKLTELTMKELCRIFYEIIVLYPIILFFSRTLINTHIIRRQAKIS